MMSKEGKISLFDPNALNSMEFTGYDLTMAVAELLDNSLDEDSTDIKIVMTVAKVLVRHNSNNKVVKLAVIDNGNGMTPEVLQKALTVGGSTHSIDQYKGKKKSIGKFGMGLPQASLNMAKIVHVWSWQNGADSSKHAFIDRTVINDEPCIEYPDDLPIPKQYVQFVNNSNSGTIVEWSELINTSFSRKPETIYNDLKIKIGRIYRHYLHDDLCKISTISIDYDGKQLEDPRMFVPVDPLFLMNDGYDGCKKESAPVTPLFEEYGKMTYNFRINPEDETEYPITLRFSIARKEVWPGDLNDPKVPGDHEYGKFAAKLTGVSIVRAKRELEFIDDWHCPDLDDPRNRWWGVEIDFDPAFDSIFGVDNRKQSAKLFHEYSVKPKKKVLDEFGLKDDTASLELDSLKEQNPSVYILLTIILKVDKIIEDMTSHINSARTGGTSEKKKKRYKDIPSNNPEKYDAVAVQRGQYSRSQSTTDKIIEQNGGDRLPGVEKALAEDDSYSSDEIEMITRDVKEGHRCSIDRCNLDSSALFGVDRKDSHMILKLNTEHPMYQKIFGIYERCMDDSIKGDPMIMLQKAYDSLELMLAGWVRMEDEALTKKEKDNYREIRENWGRILSELEYHDSDN